MDPQRLIQMANQIARNLTAQGEAAAIRQTAQHIKDFWDPRMKAAILALDILALDRAGLDPIAAAAVARIAELQA